MIDRDLIESHPLRDKIREAIANLVATGVLDAQEQRLQAQLLNGSDEEDKEKLAERVLEFRKQRTGILTLRQIGLDIIEEQKP